MQSKIYAIRNKKDTRLLWSNELGWTKKGNQYELFEENEKSVSSLPIDGEWIVVGIMRTGEPL